MTTATKARPGHRSRRLLIKAGVVGVAAAGLLSLTATEASASSLPGKIGGTSVSQRDCYHPSKQPYPSTSCSFIQTIPSGTPVVLVCQKDGQSISGDVWWDYVKTPAGVYGYVSDYYVNTGQSQHRCPGWTSATTDPIPAGASAAVSCRPADRPGQQGGSCSPPRYIGATYTSDRYPRRPSGQRTPYQSDAAATFGLSFTPVDCTSALVSSAPCS